MTAKFCQWGWKALRSYLSLTTLAPEVSYTPAILTFTFDRIKSTLRTSSERIACTMLVRPCSSSSITGAGSHLAKPCDGWRQRRGGSINIWSSLNTCVAELYTNLNSGKMSIFSHFQEWYPVGGLGYVSPYSPVASTKLAMLPLEEEGKEGSPYSDNI